jgi:hypothetical protein
MKKYAHLLIIAALSIVTIFGLLRLGNIDISLDTLARVNGSWLFLAFVTFYLSIIARGLRWQHILKTMDWPVPTLYAQTLLTAGLFISSILPARAGDLGRIAMLKQDHQIPVSQGLASLAAERALDVFAVLILAIVGAIWSLQGRVPLEVMELMVGSGVLFGLGLVGLLAVPSIEGWLRQPGWVWRIMPAVIRPFYQKVADFGFALIHGVRDLGQKPAALAAIVAESFGIWLFDALIVHLVLFSLGHSVSFSVSLFSAMVGVLATIVPLMPGALGQFEAAVISLLTLLGISTADSSLAALLVRFISLWSFIPVSGLITYFFGFSRALSLNTKHVEPSESVPAKSAATTVES